MVRVTTTLAVVGKMNKKMVPVILAFTSVGLSVAITIGSVLVNKTGLPFAWLRYEWRDPSYIEIVQYKGLWLDVIFWLVIVLSFLGVIRKLRKLSFSMKKTIIMVNIMLILALDWAALHDILKGEPNPYGEYAILFLSPFLLGMMLRLYKRYK